MNELLHNDSKDAIGNTICSIGAIGSVFGMEKLQSLVNVRTFKRIAEIIQSNSSDLNLVRNSVAVLTICSFNSDAHSILTTPEVVQQLIELSQSDDSTLRELIATVLCNLSFSDTYNELLVDFGLIGTLTIYIY